MKFENEEEKEEMCKKILVLVSRVARRFSYRFPQHSLDDLISEGLLAVWKKINKFDPSRCELKTFAHIVASTRYCVMLNKGV